MFSWPSKAIHDNKTSKRRQEGEYPAKSFEADSCDILDDILVHFFILRRVRVSFSMVVRKIVNCLAEIRVALAINWNH
jgi:hypothetical protein